MGGGQPQMDLVAAELEYYLALHNGIAVQLGLWRFCRQDGTHDSGVWVKNGAASSVWQNCMAALQFWRAVMAACRVGGGCGFPICCC